MSSLIGTQRVTKMVQLGAALAAAAGMAGSVLAQAEVKPVEQGQPQPQPGMVQPAQPGQPGMVQPAQPGQPGMPGGAGGPGGMQPMPTPQTPQYKESPLVFDEMHHDWGVVPDTNKLTHSFKFKNTGDQKVKIVASASCGCTVAALSKTEYAPGEEGEITATFDPHGRPGKNHKTITVTITEPAGVYQQSQLQLDSEVKAMVLIEPNRLFFQNVDHRVGATQRLVITGRKEGFEIAGIESSNPHVKATIAGKRDDVDHGDPVVRYDVDVEVTPGIEIGQLQGQLMIKHNDERVQTNPLPFGGDIVGDIRSTPNQAFLHGLTKNTPFSTQLRLDNRAGTPFKITSVALEGMPDSAHVVTDLDQMGDGDGMYYILKIVGVGPGDVNVLHGNLVIETDHEAERISIPVNGAVRTRGTSRVVPTAG